MSQLWSYVESHTIRGACQCGRCTDAPNDPQSKQPLGHTADLMFFKVAAVNDPNREDFISVVKSHRGDFAEVNLFDVNEHSYIEVGAWAGDQGMALMLMGLGTVLGVW